MNRNCNLNVSLPRGSLLLRGGDQVNTVLQLYVDKKIHRAVISLLHDITRAVCDCVSKISPLSILSFSFIYTLSSSISLLRSLVMFAL